MVLVKLDSPKGAHFAGGDIAAPVTQIVLRAALSARDAALNREDLAASERAGTHDKAAHDTKAKLSEDEEVRVAAADRRGRPDPQAYDPNRNIGRKDSDATPSYTVDLPATPRPAPVAVAPRPVPDVRGLSVREAVRALHGAGFRVRLLSAAQSGTSPAAGTIAAPGTIVQLARPLE